MIQKKVETKPKVVLKYLMEGATAYAVDKAIIMFLEHKFQIKEIEHLTKKSGCGVNK